MRRNVCLAFALICAGLLVPSIARASAAAVIVVGKAPDHERDVVASVIRDVLRAESWSLRDEPIDPGHAQSILRCLSGADRPWRCIAPTAQQLGIERMVVALVDSEKDKNGTQLVVSAYLVIPGNGIAPFEKQVCPAKCSEPALVAVANDITKALLRGLPTLLKDSTTLDVQTDPSGATVLVDNLAVGRSNNTFSIAPGRHEIAIELAGYKREVRTVTLGEGEMQPLAITLVKDSSTPGGGTGPSDRPWLVPALVGGGGVLLVVAGGIWQASTGAPDQFEQPQRLYNKPAIGMIAGGGVAIGVGAYLWFARSKSSSAPTVSISHDGGMIGWSGRY